MRYGLRSATALWLASLSVTVPLSPADAASCKALKGAFVGFGEEAARIYADAALDRAIVAWETRYGVKAEPKDRKIACKDYITFLNEFECTAEAVLCR
jgi:hypothetical protein